MPKLDGYKTREKILRVSEDLFAERGFHETSIAMIGKAAGANKALVYYHFENKRDILLSIYENMMRGISEALNKKKEESPGYTVKSKLREELKLMGKYRKCITIMFAEALKEGNDDDFFFRSADSIIKKETEEKIQSGDSRRKMKAREYRIREFFTGFVPMIAFIALRSKYMSYSDIGEEELTEKFIESFIETHMKDHPVSEEL